MQDFKKLEVWRKAHELTLDVYRATESFPRTVGLWAYDAVETVVQLDPSEYR